ncbi:methyltransferase domain-containing protein, partial [bacterium]
GYLGRLVKTRREAVFGEIEELGYPRLADWLRVNINKELEAQIEAIGSYTRKAIDQNQLKAFVRLHDKTVSIARSLRIASETEGVGQGVLQVMADNPAMMQVVFGLKNAALLDNIRHLDGLKDILWGLRQIEGPSIQIAGLPDDRYYIYDEYALKRLAREEGLDLGVSKEGLEHLIKMHMAGRFGIFFEALNAPIDAAFYAVVSRIGPAILTREPGRRFTSWDAQAFIYRADELSSRVFEIEKPSVDTVFITGFNRPKSFSKELEAELENWRIFNQYAAIVAINSSWPYLRIPEPPFVKHDVTKADITAEHTAVLRELKERFGAHINVEFYHLTLPDRIGDLTSWAEKLVEIYGQAYAEGRLRPEIEQLLRENGIMDAEGRMDMVQMVKYFVKNPFIDISGLRNYTVLLGIGDKAIMNIDDDAPPETYIAPDRKEIIAQRIAARNRLFAQMLEEVSHELGRDITGEAAFYEFLADPASRARVSRIEEKYFGYSQDSGNGLIPQAMEEIKSKDKQYLRDKKGLGRELRLTHQRYQPLMEPLADWMVRISDFVYPQPRREKEEGAFRVLPVNTMGSGRLIGRPAGETGFPLMKRDLRGTMAVPVLRDEEEYKKLQRKIVTYLPFAFVLDQDTAALPQFIRFLDSDEKSGKNLQHAHQMALVVEGVGGFAGDTNVIFNRAILRNVLPTPSPGRDLRLEEPPYIIWVAAPIMLNDVTVCYPPVGGGQQRSIEERHYTISFQDFTEVVGALAKETYRKAVADFYSELARSEELRRPDNYFGRMRALGIKYMDAAKAFQQLTDEQKGTLIGQRQIRAMLVAELGRQRGAKEAQLRESPADESLAQQIRDIDLILIQYADDFYLYRVSNRAKNDYTPQEGSYMYKITAQEDKIVWQAVQAELTVGPVRGILKCQQSSWNIADGRQGLIDRVLWEAGKPLEVEPGKVMIIRQLPEAGEEMIVPAIPQELEGDYIRAIVKKAAGQIKSDGETILIWPELLQAAKNWREVHKDKVVSSPLEGVERIGALVTAKLEQFGAGKDKAFNVRLEREKDNLIALGAVIGEDRLRNVLNLIERVNEYDYQSGAKGFAETVTDIFGILMESYREGEREERAANLADSLPAVISRLDASEIIWQVFTLAQSLANMPQGEAGVLPIETALKFINKADGWMDKIGSDNVAAIVRIQKLLDYLPQDSVLPEELAYLLRGLEGETDRAVIGGRISDLESKAVSEVKRLPIRIAEIDALGYRDEDDSRVVKDLLRINKLIKTTLWGGKISVDSLRKQKREGARVFAAYVEAGGHKHIVGQIALKANSMRLIGILDIFQKNFGIGSLLVLKTLEVNRAEGFRTQIFKVRDTNAPMISFVRGLASRYPYIIERIRERALPNPWGDTEDGILEMAIYIKEAASSPLEKGYGSQNGIRGPPLSVRQFLCLTALEFASAKGLDLNSEQDRELLRQGIISLYENRRIGFPAGDAVIIPFILSRDSGIPAHMEVSRRIKQLTAAIETNLDNVLKAIILEDSTGRVYRYLSKTYKRLMQEVIGVAVEDEFINIKSLPQPDEGELSARISEGVNKAIRRLLEKGRFSEEKEPLIFNLLSPMLKEALGFVPSVSHQEMVGRITDLVSEDPYLVIELLKEYFHLRLQEGYNPQELQEIFADVNGESIFSDAEMMKLLSGLRERGDKAHEFLIERIRSYINRDRTRIYRLLIIAAGSGRLARELISEFGENLQIVESDLEADVITRNFRNNVRHSLQQKIESVPADAGNLSVWGDESFDIVICFGGLRYFGYSRAEQASREISRVVKDNGVVFIGDVLQRNTWPYLISYFQHKLGQHLFVHTEHTQAKVFRNTTFYNLLYQYRYHQDREFNQALRTAVDSIKGRRSYQETILECVGLKLGQIWLISAAKNRGIVRDDAAESSRQSQIVIVSGAAGVGKSTAAAKIAQGLQGFNLSFGIIYRALVWLANKEGLDVSRQEEILSLKDTLERYVRLENNQNSQPRVLYRNTDITDDLDRQMLTIERGLVAAHPAIHNVVNPYLFSMLAYLIRQGIDVVIDARPSALRNV